MNRHPPNRWKGLVLGAAGGAAGTLAMGYFFQTMASLMGDDSSESSDDESHETRTLDDISLIGKHYHDDESSTAALGRIVYQTLAGKEPQQETKSTMSQLVHWSFGMANGAMYGATRADADLPDALGGALFGGCVWLFASNLMIPMLGLSAGPTSTPARQHASQLGGHIVYGVTTAATTQILRRIL